ncbi:MAG: recombinase family protein [Spirochaetales bacterium]|nr:recombinase family protein [Spirochaetales bacterium]
MTDKMKPNHLSRKAIVYVRQSSQFQVQNNPESQRLQYNMKKRIVDLGWPHVEIIDDDLGQSASGAVVRTGFERMVSEVCMGSIGGIAARELSRFARNSREWQVQVSVHSRTWKGSSFAGVHSGIKSLNIRTLSGNYQNMCYY